MYATSHMGTVETNKVLRNTFALLALTLIPTIGGAWAALAMGLPAIMAASPWLSLGAFLLIAFGLIFAVQATADSAAGIPVLGAFTFVMGAVLSGVLSAALKLSNGPELIGLAFAGTAGAMVACSTYAMTTKRDFSGMGLGLFGVLIGVVIIGVLNIWLQLSWLSLLLAAVSLVLFTFYLIYDVQQVVNGGETNYIRATMSIYLDLINIFSSLLQILIALFGGGDD